MSKRIAFVTDPLEQLNEKETTLLLMEAAQTYGYQLFWMEIADLHIQQNRPVGYMTPFQIHQGQIDLGQAFLAPLDQLNLIWWRKAPPYNPDTLFALDALQMLPPSTLVLNDPRTLRSANEHLFALRFSDFSPPSLVTKEPEAIKAFLSEVGGKATLRPLFAQQGHNMFFLRMGDPNLKLLSESLTQQGTQYVLVQKLITDASLDGDKRIFLLNGSLLGVALQIPTIGELRGSFERGSEAASVNLTEKDQAMIRVIGSTLKEQGIFLATLDVSDGLLIELNLSCPNGLTELQSISSQSILDPIFQTLAMMLR
jgi:glutathione synthase